MGIAARQGKRKQSTADRLRGNSSSSSTYGADFQRTRKLVLERDDYTCQGCGAQNHPSRPTNVVLTVHHIVGVARGGANMMHNYITLCNHCHAKVPGKSNRRGASMLKSLKRGTDSSKLGESWRDHE